MLYAGTGVSLSCCVTLDPSVNNNENVSIDWMTDGDIIQDRYTFSETKKISEAMFTRDMIISPLALSDASIDFICTGTVTSHTNSTQSIANSTKNITVEGKILSLIMFYKLYLFLQTCQTQLLVWSLIVITWLELTTLS